MNSMSSLVWKGMSAPIDPLIVVYTKTSLPPDTKATLVILKRTISDQLGSPRTALARGYLRRHHTANVVVHQKTGLVRGTHQVALLVHDTSTGRIVVDRLTDVIGQPVDKDVSKLVSTRHRFVIHHLGSGDPPRLRIVSKDQELSRGDSLVGDKECRLLDVSYNDPGSLHVQR
jgi:hypothetical protein